MDKNVHKSETQEIRRRKMNIDKYRVAANIIEYHIKSKLIFLRIIPKFLKIRQLFQVKNVCKNVKNRVGPVIRYGRISGNLIF